MERNEHDFYVLAKSQGTVEAVTRFSEDKKLEFPGVASFELKMTDKYGPQLILTAFGAEGKWPITVTTDYHIARPRIEIPVMSVDTLRFLIDLEKAIPEAKRLIKSWERQKGLR